MKLIVTTAGRTNREFISLSQSIAETLDATYLPRKKVSITDIQSNYHDDVLVVGKNRIEIHPLNDTEPLFFHPNSSVFRIKRLMKSKSHDPFLHATQLASRMSFLDCTLGLGSDSIVASFLVGSTGNVVGIEGSRPLSYIVKTGLQTWDTGVDIINQAMRSIHVKHDDYLTFLTSCPTNSFDVVYFDPMFEETIQESDGIKGIKPFAMYTEVSLDAINEAKRVAKKRVVLKNFWKSHSFEKFGFRVYKRKTAKFHYGTIELG